MALWAQSKLAIVGRVAGLRSLATRVAQVAESTNVEDSEGREEAHKLAGSLGVFGLAEGSRIAREIELGLAGGTLSASRFCELADLLVAAVESGPADADVVQEQKPSPLAQCFVLVIADLPPFIEQLTAAADRLRVDVVACESFGAWESTRGNDPAVAIVDLGSPSAAPAIRTLTGRGVPTYGLSPDLSLGNRLIVSRVGGMALMDSSAAPEDMLARVNIHLLPHQDKLVLVVDDDDLILRATATAFSGQGMRVETLGDPLRFWEELERVGPDAVLLDVDMPDVYGIELCSIMRSEPRWDHVPIVIFTARDDLVTVRDALEAGADDFVAKNDVGPELVLRVLGRIEDARRRHSGADRPSESLSDADIAVVEDDEAVAAVLSTVLVSNGYTVEWFEDGSRAADRLTGNERLRVRLVLLDVNLPGTDGFAVLRALVRDGVLQSTSVLMVSARAGESEVLKALRLGATDHIAKPFSVPVLLERVRRILQY